MHLMHKSCTIFLSTCNTWNQQTRTDDVGKIACMAFLSFMSRSIMKALKQILTRVSIISCGKCNQIVKSVLVYSQYVRRNNNNVVNVVKLGPLVNGVTVVKAKLSDCPVFSTDCFWSFVLYYIPTITNILDKTL